MAPSVRAARAGLLIFALLLPPVLWYLNSPVGLHLVSPLAKFENLPVAGPLIGTVLRAIAALYSWPLRLGSPDPGIVFFGLYPLFAALLAIRKHYREALWLLLVPLLLSWLFFRSLLT